MIISSFSALWYTRPDLPLRRVRLNLRPHVPGPDKPSVNILSDHDDRTVNIWMKKKSVHSRTTGKWLLDGARIYEKYQSTISIYEVVLQVLFPVLAHLAKHCKNKLLSLWVYFSRQAMILQEGNVCYIFSPYPICLYLCFIPNNIILFH